MSRLASVTPTSGQTHAGLWLERGLEAGTEDKQAKRSLIMAVAEKLGVATSGYDAFFPRWCEALRALRRGDGSGLTKALTLETLDRLTVGLGGESVLETSITLHRTYGVPFVPGSAFKGVAARRAATLGGDWARDGHAFKLLFGHAGDEEGQSGVVTFHDALPEPNKWKFLVDTITVHHPKYYATGEAAPTDWDDPTPVPFLTCTGTFRLFLTGPAAWIERATDLLDDALTQDGIGAKTTLGYGRMRIPERASRLAAATPVLPGGTKPARDGESRESPEAAFLVRVEGRVKQLAKGNAAQQVPMLLADCPAGARAALARAIETRLERKWLAGKPWAVDLLRLLEGEPPKRLSTTRDDEP